MREVLLNICLTAVALCIFKMLVPENSMKKQTDFLIACFFLASLAVFFTTGRINLNNINAESLLDFSSADIPYSDFEAAHANAQMRAIEREMQSSILKILADEEIFPKEIYINISINDNISDKYSISINEIRLVLDLEHENSRAINQEEDAEENEFVENEPNDESLEILKKAMQIIQKEVGDKILITGEFKSDSV